MNLEPMDKISMDKITSLHDHLRSAALELAWRQWTAAGVAGLEESTATVIDPEALLLASLSLGRYDARLFDEILDWLVRNSALLDLARLRRLSGRASLSERRLLQAAAQVAVQGGGAGNLGRLLEGGQGAGRLAADGGPEPLFYSQEHAGTGWGETDSVFASVGFARSTVVLRGLSSRPRTANPASLRFRLRALVGMGSRAEVLTYLLTHDWAHGRLIAERTAYGQAPVASYLASLLEARLAERREEGKKALYRVNDQLREVFPDCPAFVDWVRVWPALTGVVEALRPAQFTEEARWVRVAEALDRHEAALRAEGFGVAVGEPRGWALEGTEVLVTALEKVTARVKELAA